MVSVIIPNYNHAPYLEERIESVINQTYKNFEIIVLDDCSKDGSREIIERYRNTVNNLNIFYNEKNSGSPFAQWEKGIKLAKGEYIWIAESDDYCDHNFLEIALERIEEDKADIFVAKSVRVDEQSKFLDELEWWFKDLDDVKWTKDFVNDARDELKNYLCKKCTIVNASAVVFRNKSGIFDYLSNLKSFKSCGDWLFWLLYLHNSKFIAYSTATANYFRSHAATTRATIPFARNFEVLRIYKWVCQNILNGKESLKLATYYFSVHLHFHSRKKMIRNLRFVFQSFRYTSFTFWFLIKYYLQVRLFKGVVK